MVELSMKGGDNMKIILKCGECQAKYVVESSRVANGTFGDSCSNCNTFVPNSIRKRAQNIVNLANHIEDDGWEVFFVPDEMLPNKLFLTTLQQDT